MCASQRGRQPQEVLEECTPLTGAPSLVALSGKLPRGALAWQSLRALGRLHASSLWSGLEELGQLPCEGRRGGLLEPSGSPPAPQQAAVQILGQREAPTGLSCPSEAGSVISPI